MPTIAKNGSSEPGLSNEKWHVSLGQDLPQLEKRVGSIPITAIHDFLNGGTMEEL